MSTFWCMGSVDMMCEFFEECDKQGLGTDQEYERIGLLIEIGKKYPEFVAGVSKLSRKELIAHFGQHYNKILEIKNE